MSTTGSSMIVTCVICFTIQLIQSFPRYVVSEDVLSDNYMNLNVKYPELSHRLQRDKRSASFEFGPHSTYSTDNGLMCYVCRPGFYKLGDCERNRTTAVCEPCPSGMYNSVYNIAMRCAMCTPFCKKINTVIYRQCTTTADMTCRCKDGFYHHSKGGEEGVCIPHSKCLPGFEVVTSGTHETNTQCRSCPVGTYTSVSSSTEKCRTCSRCTSDQSVESNCVSTADTVCKSNGKAMVLEIVLPIVILVVVGAGLILICLWRKGYLDLCICQRLSSREYSGNDNGSGMGMSELELGANGGVYVDMNRNEGIENSVENSVENSKKLWTEVFRNVSRKINLDEWKLVIRTLLSRYNETTVVESKINEICYNCPNDVREQIYQCLLAWLQCAADEAFLDDIISALAQDNMLALAQELQKNYSVLLSADSFTEI